MLESGFRYLHQLGDGYVLITNDTVVKKLYTGYPYPQFDAPQEDLLYDFVCIHHRSWNPNYYISNVKDDLIADIKKLFTNTDVASIEEIFYPSGEIEKFKFLQTIGNCSIFIGKYSPKLLQIPDIVVHSKSDDCYLVVPNNKFTKELQKFVDISTRTTLTYKVLPAYSLPFTPNKIHVFTANTRNDALHSILEEFVSIWSKSVNKTLDIGFIHDFSKQLFYNIPNRYINDYTATDFLRLYEKYVAVVTYYFQERYSTIVEKFPFSKRDLKFNIPKGLLGFIITTNYYNIDASLFNSHILEKLSSSFVVYKDGVAWLDAKKLFTGEYAFCLNLLKSMNKFGDFKYKKRLEAIKALDIPDKILSKHLLMSTGSDSFFKAFYDHCYFDLENFYEFNIFIDKVTIVNSYVVNIESRVLKDFYEEFKPNLNCTIDEFIEKHFDYYKYAGTLIGLTYSLDSLEVVSYSWDSNRGIILYYRTED